MDLIWQQLGVWLCQEGGPSSLIEITLILFFSLSLLKLNSGVESGRFTQQEIKNQSYLLNGSEQVLSQGSDFSYPRFWLACHLSIMV